MNNPTALRRISALASDLPAGVTFVNDTPGGTAGTIYTYRVQACNPLGCSAPAVTNSVALP